MCVLFYLTGEYCLKPRHIKYYIDLKSEKVQYHSMEALIEDKSKWFQKAIMGQKFHEIEIHELISSKGRRLKTRLKTRENAGIILSPLCISNTTLRNWFWGFLKKLIKCQYVVDTIVIFFVHEFELQFYPTITQWVLNSYYIYQDFQVLMVKQISGFHFPSQLKSPAMK